MHFIFEWYVPTTIIRLLCIHIEFDGLDECYMTGNVVHPLYHILVLLLPSSESSFQICVQFEGMVADQIPCHKVGFGATFQR